MMQRIRQQKYPFFLVCVFSLLNNSCNHSGTAGAKNEAEPAGVQQTVAVAKVTREDMSQQIELSAEFLPFREAELNSKVTGYVKEIRVDIGDRVTEGQVVATLEVPEFSSDVEQAAAARKSSESEVLQARSEVQRAQSVLDAARLVYTRLSSISRSRPDLLARQEVDDALAKLEVAEAQFDRAKAGLAVAEDQVRVQIARESRAKTMAEYLTIAAPFSGVITERYVHQGAMISEGPIVRISEIQHLRLTLQVPESAVPQIRIGQILNVRVPALGKTFEGLISRYSNRIDASTRTMETEVDVPNPDLVLKPGMYAFVDLPLTVKADAITVPVQALSRQGETATVMVVNSKNKLEERKVSTGIESPTRVEITSGLDEHERVVIGTRSRLQPGQRVTPKDIALGAAGEKL